MKKEERPDFIQIDFRENQFITVCITNAVPLYGTNQEKVDFAIMQRFCDNLEECIKFTIGAMSTLRLFKNEVYRPTNIIEVVFTKEAKARIKNKKYRIANLIFPDLKLMAKGW